MVEIDNKHERCNAEEKPVEQFFGFDLDDKEVSGFDTAEWTGGIESGNK
ncbi:hypothetical protein [Enterobacter asburiae]|nr:hypothetical protein [Enterobacter asburiae]WMQ95743.1 hypothetical protein RCR44_18125 [Enterobacter asburiae]BCP71372.1 hypothetical protein R1N_35590 [Enterobacter asburiae]HDT0679143.1 hypothetical protein [Enterobacter asburiae]HDV8911080.1 hypothetical protein [Enterobacter asburiae]HDX4633877.1 hypothetical protein [Enterobacter asburiae]